MADDNFRALVSEFSAALAQAREAAASLREMRKRTKEMQAAILEYMQAHGIDECALPDARLVRKSAKKTEGLKKEHIEGELKRVLDATVVEEAVAGMYNRRMTEAFETLAVVRKPPTHT